MWTSPRSARCAAAAALRAACPATRTATEEEQLTLAGWQAWFLSRILLRGLCSVWPVESWLDSDGLVERREAPHPMGAGVGYQKCLLVCFSLMLRVNVCGIYKVIWNLSDL